MRDEFDFDHIASSGFCVSRWDPEEEATNYLVPSDRNVQRALQEILMATLRNLEAPEGGLQPFELSEKYAAKEALIADLDAEETITVRSLYEEEGWASNPGALHQPARISYYFAVFRDRARRKLLGVRRATLFKGIVESRLVTLVDDSLTMVGDQVFKLDTEFVFLLTSQHVYILHPLGFEAVAGIEEFASAKAREKALALGAHIKFADFGRLAEFVSRHKRAARLVAGLSARADLGRIQKSRFQAAATTTQVTLEKVGRKISPAMGSELAFLELLDDRRYATAIRSGPREAFVASSRRPLRPAALVAR